MSIPMDGNFSIIDSNTQKIISSYKNVVKQCYDRVGVASHFNNPNIFISSGNFGPSVIDLRMNEIAKIF